MPTEFETDHKEALAACGFQVEIISHCERMVKRVNDRTFSAVPWTLMDEFRTPTIWLVELIKYVDTYADSETDINEFVSKHS